MKRWTAFGAVCGVLFATAPPALPCSLCTPNANSKTLRQDAAEAKLVLYGRLANARLNPAGFVGFTDGATDLHIEKILKSDAILANKNVAELPRYLPPD